MSFGGDCIVNRLTPTGRPPPTHPTLPQYAGGPNYLAGLDMMRALGAELGVPIEVGTPLTANTCAVAGLWQQLPNLSLGLLEHSMQHVPSEKPMYQPACRARLAGFPFSGVHPWSLARTHVCPILRGLSPGVRPGGIHDRHLSARDRLHFQL